MRNLILFYNEITGKPRELLLRTKDNCMRVITPQTKHVKKNHERMKDRGILLDKSRNYKERGYNLSR